MALSQTDIQDVMLETKPEQKNKLLAMSASVTDSDTSLGERLQSNPDDQYKVGAYVANIKNKLIANNARLFIGSGAASYYFFQALVALDREVEIFTNNMLVASAYSTHKSAIKKVTVLGTGEVDNVYGHVRVADEVLAEAVGSCDAVVVSPTLVDSDLGPSSTSADTRDARVTIFSAAKNKIIILSDRKKLSYLPVEGEESYDYPSGEWRVRLGELANRLYLVTTRHDGVAATDRISSRAGVKEAGRVDSFSTYCRNSIEYYTILHDKYVELAPSVY